ncbi:hypothetical protein JOF53_007545 [Crossiella equi]|uniref:Tetracyclin repressor-like C-terminal domain-containing protein n=1 Tax=Crossiella equi TaxID=130796 RepID=A0ABS5AQ24_9PSEU|nr:hypothetical protein [Crossiella equi]MBP2478673.1 hypothetical protein [Crossiella equi]
MSADPERDATALWTGLHGVVGLVGTLPRFPWPEAPDLVRMLVDRLACLG